MLGSLFLFFFFFSSRRRHTRCSRDWSSDVCSSDLHLIESDAELFRGRYRDALKSALVRRGILSLQTASLVTGPGPGAKARRARGTAPAAGESHTRRLSLSADEFGFEGRALFVEAPGEARRVDLASAAEDLGSPTGPGPTLAGRGVGRGVLCGGWAGP